MYGNCNRPFVGHMGCITSHFLRLNWVLPDVVWYHGTLSCLFQTCLVTLSLIFLALANNVYMILSLTNTGFKWIVKVQHGAYAACQIGSGWTFDCIFKKRELDQAPQAQVDPWD